MQSVFDRMLGSKGPLHLEKVTPPNAIIEAMGKFEWKEDAVMPKDGWFAVAGEDTPQLAAEATAKWRALAGNEEEAFAAQPGDDSYAAYAGFKRDFALKSDFFSSGEVRMDWGVDKTPVKYFGVGPGDADRYADNVRVLVYKPEDKSQALQFLAREGDDTMVLYTPPGAMRMEAAIRLLKVALVAWPTRAETRSAATDKHLHMMDRLQVPEISLEREEDLTKAFTGALHFAGQSGTGRTTQAKTSVKLDVDAKGVKVKAKAEMHGRGFGAAPDPPKPVPRVFQFDRPFFLLLWRDDADRPYAGVWIGSAEGLVK